MRFTQATLPETIPQLWRRSFQLYRFTMPYVLVLSLALSVITFIPRIFDVLIGHPLLGDLPVFSPYRLWLLLIDIGVLFLFTAMLWRVRSLMTDSHESYQEDLRVASKKLPRIFAAALIQGFLILLIALTTYGFMTYLSQQNLQLGSNPFAAILLLIPFIFQILISIFIFFLFYFYLVLILHEDKGIMTSLYQSAHLVWKHWWQTLCVQGFPWVFYFLLLLVIRNFLHLDINIYFIAVGKDSLLITLLQILLFALFVPWLATSMLVQLRDLELRQIEM